MPPLNSVVIQQGQIHTQTQVQEYECKSTMSRRVINETTLRIYVPKNPDADLTLRTSSTRSLGHFYSANSVRLSATLQRKADNRARETNLLNMTTNITK